MIKNSLEKMASRYYALTISPPYRDHSIKYLYKWDKPFIQKALNRCSRYYIMYPELDLQGRLHYHGVVRLTSLTSWGFVKRTIDNDIGFACIKKIKGFKEHLGWLLYCRKEDQTQLPKPILPYIFPKGRPKNSPAQRHTRLTLYDFLNLDEGVAEQ